MDKKIIKQNSGLGLKKHNFFDKKLRILDNKKYINKRNIEKLSQDIFILNREISDICKVIKKNTYYQNSNYKKNVNFKTRLFISTKQIKLVTLKLMLKFYKQRDRYLNNKINSLI